MSSDRPVSSKPQPEQTPAQQAETLRNALQALTDYVDESPDVYIDTELAKRVSVARAALRAAVEPSAQVECPLCHKMVGDTVICPEATRGRCPFQARAAVSPQASETGWQQAKKRLSQMADAAYLGYTEAASRVELLLGSEYKIKHGLFTEENLAAHRDHAEQLGRHKALGEAVNIIEAELAQARAAVSPREQEVERLKKISDAAFHVVMQWGSGTEESTEQAISELEGLFQ